MINIWIILVLLIVHWFADFVIQTDWQAKNKSTDDDALFAHIGTYMLCWVPVSIFMFLEQPWKAGIFILITFVTHLNIDFYTSRLNTRLWKKGDTHNFFVSVGFDQFLHTAQLILTYYMLCSHTSF